MNKLFKLKKWLTVSETARHLSIACGEEVGETDVLRLALDGHLMLSVNFVNHAIAMGGRVVPIEDAKRSELSPEFVALLPIKTEGKPVMMVDGIQVNDKEVLELEGDLTTLDGVYDLPMIGGEKLDIEHHYQTLNGGPSVTLTAMEGAFVKGQDGLLYQLQESFDENEFAPGSKAQLRMLKEKIKLDNFESMKAEELLDQHKEQRKKFLAAKQAKKDAGRDWDNYHPAQGLPDDSVLVVRTEAIREFEDLIIQNENERNIQLQNDAHALAEEWRSKGSKSITKREIAKALARSNEWCELTATNIERLIRVTW